MLDSSVSVLSALSELGIANTPQNAEVCELVDSLAQCECLAAAMEEVRLRPGAGAERRDAFCEIARGLLAHLLDGSEPEDLSQPMRVLVADAQRKVGARARPLLTPTSSLDRITPPAKRIRLDGALPRSHCCPPRPMMHRLCRAHAIACTPAALPL
jgi:hypothetical protein